MNVNPTRVIWRFSKGPPFFVWLPLCLLNFSPTSKGCVRMHVRVRTSRGHMKVR